MFPLSFLLPAPDFKQRSSIQANEVFVICFNHNIKSLFVVTIFAGMSGENSVLAAFQDWMGELETESELKDTIRTRVRDLEAAGRELAAILQKIHHTSGFSDLQTVARQSDEFFQSKIRGLFNLLSEAVPKGQYYRL